jgi:hypothetical protein
MTDTTTLNQYIAEGRLLRKKWVGTDKHGREAACLLAALSPKVAHFRHSNACPANIMPKWLAHLTPWMDDEGSDDAWLGMVKRYAAVAGRWHVLSNEIWRELDYTARRIALENCIPSHDETSSVKERVIALLRRAEVGGSVTDWEWSTATRSAAYVLYDDAGCAAHAASQVTSNSEGAPRAAARAAARAADSSGDATTVVDRITAAILAAIEQACDKAEKEKNNESV